MSSEFWSDGFDWFGELLVNLWVNGTMPDRGAGRKGAEKVAVHPVVLRANRSGTKSAAAIRTDVVQSVLDTRTAESAFKRANHRVRGIWRKRRVAVLAGGP